MGLNPYNIWFPLLTLVGFAVVAPPLYFWLLPEFQQYPEHIVFLSSMVPVFLVLLIGASWLEPG